VISRHTGLIDRLIRRWVSWDIVPCSLAEIDLRLKKQCAPLKCRSISTRLHGTITQKTHLRTRGRENLKISQAYSIWRHNVYFQTKNLSVKITRLQIQFFAREHCLQCELFSVAHRSFFSRQIRQQKHCVFGTGIVVVPHSKRDKRQSCSHIMLCLQSHTTHCC
jgi:hypothetical protein